MLAMAPGLLGACADILDIPDSPTLVMSDPWQCNNTAHAPTSPRAQVVVHACNFISSNCSVPVTGITANLCDKLDVNCSQPVQTDIRDVDGDLRFDVPTTGSLGNGFDGYLRVVPPLGLCTNDLATNLAACDAAPACDIIAPDEKCMVPKFIPALLFFNPPIVNSTGAPVVLPLLPTTSSINLVQAAGGPKVQNAQGIVVLTGLDCAGYPAPGLTFNVSPQSQQLARIYVANGAVSATAQATDESGLGALLGVPPGFVEVSAYTVSAQANFVRVASANVQVRPLTATYVALTPSYR
jgi:hypothetical protein